MKLLPFRISCRWRLSTFLLAAGAIVIGLCSPAAHGEDRPVRPHVVLFVSDVYTNDPHEMHNLAENPARRELVQALRRRLDRWRRAQGDQVPAGTISPPSQEQSHKQSISK